MNESANIIEFPSATVRSWASMEREIALLCSQQSFSPEVEQRLKASIKPAWELLQQNMKFSIDLPFPADIADEHRRAIHDAVSSGIRRTSQDFIDGLRYAVCVSWLRRDIDFLRELGLV